MDSTWDQIAEAYAAQCRQGLSPDPEPFLAGQTDPDGELRSLLESIAMIEGLKKAGPDLPAKRNQLSLSKLTRLDEYRIVGELGRGGMGVVFQAVHESLGRRVAIKVLSTRDLDDERLLKRFEQEAKAAARLTHSNIVPVYGVGHCDGYHYYVMDLVDGQTVRQWLDAKHGPVGSTLPTVDESLESASDDFRLSETQKSVDGLTGDGLTCDGMTRVETREQASEIKPGSEIKPRSEIKPFTGAYFRWVATRVAEVCDALQYAHRQGTLHRDIKPANLLVDRSGVIRITDLGLAKLSESEGYTKTGDIVGTPQYMPPESFEGRYDELSEVYAVGLTLHEMLTGKPAIAASSQAEAIRSAIDGVTISPEKIEPAIPRDLCTIAMKALAIEPTLRYRSAAAMRDDLRNFLADRPISARRASWSGRLVRWSRREPLAAALTAAVFASLFALAVVSSLGYLRAQSLLTETRESNEKANAALAARGEALALAQQQSRRATKNLDVAISAFDEIMNNVIQRGFDLETESFGDIGESTSPDVSAADAQMLQSLLGFFDELAENNDEDFQSQSAAALRRVGDIFQRLGQLKQADEAYTKALARMDPLSQNREPDDPVADATWRAEVLNEQANIAGLRAQVPRAIELYGQTVDLLVHDGELLDSDEARFQYARANSLFASIVTRAGIELPPNASFANLMRRNAFREFAPHVKQTFQQQRAIVESIDVLQGLSEENPDETRYRVSLARAYRDQAKIASLRRQSSMARDSINESINLLRALQQQYPDSESIRYEYAKTLCSSEALAVTPMLRLGQAMRLTEMLLRSNPEMARYQELRAAALRQMSEVQMGRGNTTAAIAHCQEEQAIRRDLIEKYPDRVAYQTSQCQTLERLSELQAKSGDLAMAAQSLQEATVLAENVAETDRVSHHAQRLLGRLKDKQRRINTQSVNNPDDPQR